MRPTPLWRLAVPVLLAVLAGAATAHAQSVPPLEMVVDGCEQYDHARLRELVSIEIRTVGADAPPRRTTVRLACSGDRVAIDVADGLTGNTSRSELNLGGTTEATRLRLLALTITERVAMTWREPRAAAPPPRAPVIVASTPPPTPPQRLRLFGATSLRRMGQPGTWLAGAGAGGEYALRGWLALALDLRIETGDTATSVAAVEWRALVGTAALAFGGGDRLSWSVLPGFSVGAVRLSAVPNTPGALGDALDGVWAGPTLAVRLRYALGQSGFLQLEASAGVVTRRVVGLLNGDSPILQIQGPWSLASAGAGFSF